MDLWSDAPPQPSTRTTPAYDAADEWRSRRLLRFGRPALEGSGVGTSTKITSERYQSMSTVSVRGRLTSPTTLVLESPVLTQPETLQVELGPAPHRGDARQFVKFLDSLPPGTMTAEEIDREIEDVRGDWD